MYRLVYWPAMFLLTLFSLLPLRVHYFFADILCFFLHRVFKYRLSTIYINLSRSFPEMRYAEIKKLAGEYYSFMADMIAECIWSYTASTKSISKHIDFAGAEAMEEAFATGKNVVVVMGHQGNWELYTGLPNLKETYGINIDSHDYNFIYKKPENKIAEMVIQNIRNKHHSVSFIEIHNVIRKILGDKTKTSAFFFLADQFPAKSMRAPITFLNQPSYMIDGPEVLARKLGLPVVFYGVDRLSRGKYLATSIKVCDDASKCEEGFVTREYARLMEQFIIHNKPTWLWSHKRWKQNIEI